MPDHIDVFLSSTSRDLTAYRAALDGTGINPTSVLRPVLKIERSAITIDVIDPVTDELETITYYRCVGLTWVTKSFQGTLAFEDVNDREVR